MGWAPVSPLGVRSPRPVWAALHTKWERIQEARTRRDRAESPRILHQRAWFLVLKTGTINHFFRWFHDFWITLWFYCQIFRWSEFLFSCFFRVFFYGIQICDFGYMYLYTSLSQIHAFCWVDFSSFNLSGASNLLLLHFFPNWYKDGRKFWGFDMKWKLLQCLICFESNRISDEWWSLPIENGTWGCCFMVITKNWNFLIRMANS